jgi:hypothetical protein
VNPEIIVITRESFKYLGKEVLFFGDYSKQNLLKRNEIFFGDDK